MFPAFTAFMLSSSLVSSVPAMNCMSSSPLERLRTSSACQAKPIAADSGGGTMCAITSFLASARANVGAMPLAMMPAMPAFTRRRRPTVGRWRLLIFMIVFVMAPSQASIYENPIPLRLGREALRPVTQQCAAEAGENRSAQSVDPPLPDGLHEITREPARAQPQREIGAGLDRDKGRHQEQELRRPGRIGSDELREECRGEHQQLRSDER